MTEPKSNLPSMELEFAGLNLGDRRRNARLKRAATAIAEDPEKSFPKIFEDDAAGLEALYRLLNSEHISPRAVAKPHVRATLERCTEAHQLLAIHDTTDFSFGGDSPRDGLGAVDGSGHGFYMHTTLMVENAPGSRPLGVLGAKLWARPELPPEKRGRKNKKQRAKERKNSLDLESRRWVLGMHRTDRLLSQRRAKTIHVCDSEADDYALLADAVAHGRRFIVRQKHNRNIEGKPEQKLRDAVAADGGMFGRTVMLSARKAGKERAPKSLQTHPPRGKRLAKLEIGAVRITIRRPTSARRDLPELLENNVVYAREVGAPEGEKPVEWLLYTTEPIETVAQIAAIVDAYCARWNIELYFNALKGGCAVEKRQLTSFRALAISLSIFIPIAWRLLLMRTLADSDPQAPARAVLSAVQIDVLRAALKKTRLSAAPTVHEVLYAIAALGGHLKHNGRPGWRTLAAGYEKLLVVEIGWRAALDAVREAESRKTRSRGRGPKRFHSQL